MEELEEKVCSQCELTTPSGLSICRHCGAPLDPSSFPVELELPYPGQPGELSRLLLFLKWLLIVPMYVILFVHAFVAFLIKPFAILATLVLGRLPQGMFERTEGYLDHLFKVQAYFPLLLTDNYGADHVNYSVAYPERLSRLMVIVRLIVDWPIQLVLFSAQLALYIIAIPAWFMILLTGRYPRPLFGLSRSLLQWIAQANAWEWGLRDEWSLLFRAPLQVYATVGVGFVVLAALIGGGGTWLSTIGLGAVSEGETVLVEFFQAGRQSDVDVASQFIVDPDESRTQIKELFDNRYLFSGWLALDRKGWEWTNRSDQGEFLSLEGTWFTKKVPEASSALP